MINIRKSELILDKNEKKFSELKEESRINLNSENNDKKENNIIARSVNNNMITNEPLFSLKETFICTFCGGKNCKHENFLNHKNPAIHGLNSDKIDDNIFASQRPSNSLIKKYDLISKFKELGIELIVNLQLPGEHPYCGPDPLDESGFSYSPSIFESEDIHVGLYGWKDLDVPNSLYHMLQVVKDMYNYIHYKNKKVLVHCHAGYGRTGTTIACYKIFDEDISAEAAKDEIRKVRRQCIQNSNQFNYCVNFEKFIRRLKANFCLKEKRSIENFLKYQEDLNVGKYKFINFKYNKSVPLFLLYIFDSIIDIKNKLNIDELSLYTHLNSSINIKENDYDYELFNTIIKNINEYNWDILYSCEEPTILGILLFDWLRNSIKFIFNHENVEKINENFDDFDKCLNTCENQTLLIFDNFIKLIKDKEENEDEEINIQKNIFIRNFCKYSLGYSLEENSLDLNQSNTLNKLIKLINFINIGNNNINNVNENEEKILSNVYEHLKIYFDNKNNNKLSHSKNDEDMFKKIHNMINSREDLNLEENKKDNEIKLNKKSSAIQNFNFNSLNNSTFKLSKTMKINLRKSKVLFKESKEIVDEFEEDKDIPWIREEDC